MGQWGIAHSDCKWRILLPIPAEASGHEVHPSVLLKQSASRGNRKEHHRRVTASGKSGGKGADFNNYFDGDHNLLRLRLRARQLISPRQLSPIAFGSLVNTGGEDYLWIRFWQGGDESGSRQSNDFECHWNHYKINITNKQ
jgi:hypothetical protein